MAYIDILKQPTVGQVDSLIGIKDDEVVQIDSKDSCLSGLSNLTDAQANQVREAINALEDEAGVVDTEHLATKCVTHNKMAIGAIFAENIAGGNITYSHLSPGLRQDLNHLAGLKITSNTTSVPSEWWGILGQTEDMQYPVYYIDEYGNTFPLVKTIEEDNQKILYFSNLYSDSDVTDVYDTYISSTHITVDAPSGSDCNITTNSNETDLGSVINDVVSNYPIPIILVKGQTYSKYAVFNDTRDFTKGLKTNNIFLSVDNQLVPLSGFTATTSSYAKLYFVSVPVDNNLAGAATVFSMGCTSSSSSVLVDKITTRWNLPLCGYRSYFADISNLEVGTSQPLKDSPVFSATNCLTDGSNVWTKVHRITQEQLDSVTAKFQEVFPNANLSNLHWLFELNKLNTVIGDSVDNYTIAVFGTTIYRRA